MQFELTDAIIDEILFAMEDQNGDFLFDTREGVVVDQNDDGEEALEDTDDMERYVSLPEWDSSAGFSLMQGFAASVKNPVLQVELNKALNRGRGVFRAFKDCLASHSEVEKLWYAYKEKAMHDIIVAWYNALRVEWGLEKIGPEPEETDDLILEDFKFRKTAEGDYSLVAETSGGTPVATLVAHRDNSVFRLEKLEVRSEFRGLGVGKTLLRMFLDDNKNETISVDLPTSAEGFSRALLRESFEAVMTRYVFKSSKNEV
jgi:GNAT superfamily N-acetyltransferase